MNFNKISSNAAIKLFTALSEGNKLRILRIDCCGITDEACDAIVMAMKKNTSLVELHMEGNRISGECAQIIAQALQHNNTLQLLRLNGDYPNDISGKVRSLEEEINKKRCQVKLDIRFGWE